MPGFFLDLLEQQILGLGARQARYPLQLTALLLERLLQLLAELLGVGFTVASD